MAPVHDTDIAQERWSQAEWRHYELWEKVETRQNRRRRLWILATAIVFVLLSSVPVLFEKWPKWRSLGAMRRLAQEVNELKRLAALEHSAYRISFPQEGSLEYVIEKSARCEGSSFEVLKRGRLLEGELASFYSMVSPSLGQELGIPGLILTFCYDSLKGSQQTVSEGEQSPRLAGFGILPVKDLAEKRVDRLSVLLLKGDSAKISFD